MITLTYFHRRGALLRVTRDTERLDGAYLTPDGWVDSNDVLVEALSGDFDQGDIRLDEISFDEAATIARRLFGRGL